MGAGHPGQQLPTQGSPITRGARAGIPSTRGLAVVCGWGVQAPGTLGFVADLACARAVSSTSGAGALWARVAEGSPSLCPAAIGHPGPLLATRAHSVTPPRNRTRKGTGVASEAARGSLSPLGRRSGQAAGLGATVLSCLRQGRWFPLSEMSCSQRVCDRLAFAINMCGRTRVGPGRPLVSPSRLSARLSLVAVTASVLRVI